MKKQAFLVLVQGYWGRGETLRKAAEACRKAGGQPKDRAIARLVLGDDKPAVTDGGYMERSGDSEMIVIGNGFKLGALLKLEE
jgi:hypothetical protein